MTSKLRTLPYLLLLLPFDLVVAFCLCVSVPLCFRKHKGTETQRVASNIATIIIVNWDGKHLLAECLQALIKAVQYDGRTHEIMVVDNGSTDGALSSCAKIFLASGYYRSIAITASLQATIAASLRCAPT